jgi:hypothetical protein
MLVTEAVWAGLDLAARGASEELMQPRGCGYLIGRGLGGLRTGSCSPRDLRFERTDGPAGFSRAPREFAAAAMVRFGQQRLPVAIRQCAGVDQFDRFVGEVE